MKLTVSNTIRLTDREAAEWPSPRLILAAQRLVAGRIPLLCDWPVKGRGMEDDRLEHPKEALKPTVGVTG